MYRYAKIQGFIVQYEAGLSTEAADNRVFFISDHFFSPFPECPEGTFSGVVSNGPCETCPANSEGTGTGLTLCPCLQNYYRAPNEEPSLPCTRE